MKLHLLIKLLGQVSYHTREFVNNALDRNHSKLHNRFMQVCRNAFKVFYLLIKSRMSATAFGRCKTYERVLGDDQLGNKIHENIELFDINTYRTVDCRLRCT